MCVSLRLCVCMCKFLGGFLLDFTDFISLGQSVWNSMLVTLDPWISSSCPSCYFWVLIPNWATLYSTRDILMPAFSPVAVTSSMYVPLHLTSSVCVKSPPGPLSQIHVAVSGPIHLIQDPLHISRFLITSAKTLFPHKVTFSFQGSEPGIFGS